VHRALRISTSDDSGGAPGSKESPKQEEGPVVEKDHITSAKKEDGGAQHDNTTPVKGDAPNSEKKDDPPTNSDKHVTEVTLLSFFNLFFPNSSIVSLKSL
jgi:hypothetical protein